MDSDRKPYIFSTNYCEINQVLFENNLQNSCYATNTRIGCKSVAIPVKHQLLNIG